MAEKERIYYLLQLYVESKARPEELEELALLLEEDPESANALQYLEDMLQQAAALVKPGESRLEKILYEIRQDEQPVRVHAISRRRTWWWAAAAVLVLVAGGIYYATENSGETRQQSQVAAGKTIHLPDPAPGGDKALLTLADGTTILLDSVSNGRIAQEAGVSVSKQGGMIVYEVPGDAGTATNTDKLNALQTPRGGKYQLVLPDGTRVWLNAASVIKYPARFGGSGRNVEMSGEAYFEVARDPSRPFRVNIDGKASVEVLGTHFNIRAYQGNQQVKTTLLEGRVKVTAHNEVELNPGQQASITVNEKIRVLEHEDLEGVMAWKNELFHFSNAGVNEIMEELGRWYDIEVERSGKNVNKKFTGYISRKTNLSEVLRILKRGGIDLEMKGDKLIVND